jgi:hypothetical protein
MVLPSSVQSADSILKEIRISSVARTSFDRRKVSSKFHPQTCQHAIPLSTLSFAEQDAGGIDQREKSLISAVFPAKSAEKPLWIATLR